jgi:uncharacterized protein (DUF1499 family)
MFFFHPDVAPRPCVVMLETGPGQATQGFISNVSEGGVSSTRSSAYIESPQSVSTQGNIAQMGLPPDYDWNLPQTNRRFADLERRFIAKTLEPDGQEEYLEMRESRRSLIRSVDYMERYAEEQRLKLINRKLRELRSLIQPIRSKG